MSKDCLHASGLEPMKKALGIALALNIGMFFVEMVAAYLSHSTALQADALDFLSDSFAYGIAYWAIDKSQRWRSATALTTSATHLSFGLWVLGIAFYRLWMGLTPVASIMGSVSVLALSANIGSAYALHKHRHKDSNMMAVWIASRNDAINNILVMIAAGAVYLTASRWPDLAVAFFVAFIEITGAIQILRKVLAERRALHLPPTST